jgi:Ca2+:H+ antiporter
MAATGERCHHSGLSCVWERVARRFLERRLVCLDAGMALWCDSDSSFAVVRHAEGLAVRLGEPFGTLVLTLSMSGMEMMMIAAVMYASTGGSSLARDTMLAIVMIVLNGLVGASLLLGGLRYRKQTYNCTGRTRFYL